MSEVAQLPTPAIATRTEPIGCSFVFIQNDSGSAGVVRSAFRSGLWSVGIRSANARVRPARARPGSARARVRSGEFGTARGRGADVVVGLSPLPADQLVEPAHLALDRLQAMPLQFEGVAVDPL